MNAQAVKKLACLPLMHIILIALAALLVYSNTFDAPMTFDDDSYIIENPARTDWGSFLRAQTEDLPGFGKNLINHFRNRTVVFATFIINYQIGGSDPTGYHIVNLLIHIGASLTLYWLAILLFQTPALKHHDNSATHVAALFAALLFACHPLQTQAVTYISQRFTSLVTLFYLGALALYVRSRLSPEKKLSVMLYALSTVLVLLAVRSKETAATLPIAMILIEAACFHGLRGIKATRLLPWVVLAGIIPTTLFYQQGRVDVVSALNTAGAEWLSCYDYLLTEQRVILTYLRLLVLPINQNLDYDYPIYRSLFQAAVLGSMLIHVALIGLAIYLLRRSRTSGQTHWRWASFGIFWFYLTLSVESSFIPIADVIFEHRMYLPLAGISMAVAALGLHWAENIRRPWIAVAGALFIIIALGSAAFNRNALWASDILLWEDAARKSPGKARPHVNLGRALEKAKEYRRALDELLLATNADPGHFVAHLNLGIVLKKLGREAEAEVAYNKALAISPKDFKVCGNIGALLIEQDRLEEAHEALEHALKGNPKYPDALNNMGNLHRLLGEYSESEQHLRHALKLDPLMNETHFNLGLLMGQQRRMEESLAAFKEALRLDPSDDKARQYVETLNKR